MNKHIYFLFTSIFFLISILTIGQTLTPELLWKFGRVSDHQVSPDGKAVLFGVTRYDLVENKGKRDLYITKTNGEDTRIVRELVNSVYNARWRPDGKMIGFLSKKNGPTQLWEMDRNGHQLRQVTDFSHDISNFEYSPDMRHISFTIDLKLDETVQEKYNDLPKANARIMDDLMYRHWDAWHDYKYSHLHIAKYNDDKIVGVANDLMKDEPYDTPLQTFGGTEDITWAPDGSSIIYVSKKFNGKEYSVSTNSDLYWYHLESGKTKNLTSGMMGYDTRPAFSPDGSKIAWLSMEQDGFEADKNVLYLYDFTTGERKTITDVFKYTVSDFIWKNDKTIFIVTGVNATYQVYRIDLGTSNFEKIDVLKSDITPVTEGIHNINSIQLANNDLIAHMNSMSISAEIYHIDTKSGRFKNISSINDHILSGIKFGEVRKRMVKTTDDQEMLVWVIYPPDFDPSKKYPTLLYCQGGPQSAVSQFFSYRWNFQLMAANDYIVVAPNRRGLPTFGQAWNDDISGDWGGQAMQDYLSAIDDVAKESYVDNNALGAIGASFGGYSTFYLAGIHEKRFKTFVTHAGIYNLESWYGSTEELFFANWDLGGPYWEHPIPKSYIEFSPHKLVQKWDTPMLIIHGGNDFRIPETQAMEAFTAMKMRDIPARFLYFPEEGHWVLSPQNGVLWHREFFEWLEKWLKK